MNFKISNRTVGPKYDPLIIAEIGINHNGSLDKAIAIADSAIKYGAEVIKHQTHIPDEEMSLESRKAIPGNSKNSIYSIIKKCALNEKNEYKLMKYILSKKKIFISTPFSKAAVDRLVRFKVPAFKIGSGEWNNLELIKYVCKFRKPIIMSTGMSNIKDLFKTVNFINNKKIPLALLHCTNVYPTPLDKSRLNSITEMQKCFKNNIIGYSDHTIGLYASYAALSLGAKIIEKHYVDEFSRKGPDVSCSMNKNQLKELLKASRLIPHSLPGRKEPIKEEFVTMNFAFASVVSKTFIKKGSSLNKNNICLKRPGNGNFLTNDFSKLLGKKTLSDIPPNVQIKKKHIT